MCLPLLLAGLPSSDQAEEGYARHPSGEAALKFWVITRYTPQLTNKGNRIAWLGSRCERPRRNPTNKRDELILSARREPSLLVPSRSLR
jgi:hypothetical protein